MVSSKQSHAIVGLVGTNVDWDQVPFQAGESILADPTAFSREATRFMQNSGRVTVTVTDGITPPPGGQIQILTTVVDESRPWEDAVKAGAPQTSGVDIWKVGDQYPSSFVIKPGLRQIILANFGQRALASPDVLDWAAEYKLVPATPRAVFSASERYPELNQHLGVEHMAMVSLVECLRDGVRFVPCVWWRGVRRRADFDWFGNMWLSDGWFAFGYE